MYNELSWDDMCLVHAITQAGTLSGAARTLGVSHPTVFRKLNRLEQRLDVLFFNRARSGYSATVAAEEVCGLFENIQDEVRKVERRIAGRDLRPSGTVRLTTTDSLLFGWLSAVLADFRTRYREIQLEVVVSNNFLNLTRREADIAIRPVTVPTGSLASQQIGSITQAVYGAQALLAGTDETDILQSADWIGPDEAMPYAALHQWLQSTGRKQHCHYQANTVYGMFTAAISGMGLAVLPCYLGDNCQNLVKLGEEIPDLETPLWLLSHPDLRRSERIKVLHDHITQAAKSPEFGHRDA